MDRFIEEDRQPFTDVSTVESHRNDLTAEEFPEGPYGSDLQRETLGKSRPWRIDQRSAKPFDYENHALHEDMNRDYPGEDSDNAIIPEVHDEP